MTNVEERTVRFQDSAIRVLQKGTGPKIGFLAGYGGLPRWIPFLDHLSETRTVIVPSLPGFPGGGSGHKALDTHLDWLLAVRALLDEAGLHGCDLAGSSIGASLAAEMAAVWPNSVRRLALIAPLGLFEEKEPTGDIWAIRADKVAATLCARPEAWSALKEVPESADPVEWAIEQTRANEAAARIFFPLGNTGLEKRLPLIKTDTLLIWGDQDQIIPRSYASKFKYLLGGRVDLTVVEDAGHLAELDRPKAVARAVDGWMA